MTDTPAKAKIGDAAAKELHAHELKLLPVVGEICPVGTLAKLHKMTALVKQLREVMA